MSLQYIIDGYNIINHPLFIRAHKHRADPRTALTDFILTKKLTGSPKNKVIIVFDGYPDTKADSAENQINIVYSRRITADEKIGMLIEESGNRKNIIVVSDDNEIKSAAKFLGAHPIGVEEFISKEEKAHKNKAADLIKPELNYSQMEEINKELRKLWLRQA